MKGLIIFALIGVLYPSLTLAQSDLLDVNENTTVRRVEFEYTDADRYSPRFTTAELRELTVIRGISRYRWFRRFLGNSRSEDDRLNPIELQRDVVRLRQAFREAGYLHTHVNYSNSTHDRQKNQVVIQFSITQGPPVIIQDVGFFADQGFLATSLNEQLRKAWIDFRDQTSFDVGDVFTIFEMVQIEDQVLGWFKDQGYAFADLKTSFTVDSLYNAADISFHVDTGPPGFIDTIEVIGAPDVNRSVVLRSLPFQRGDPFSQQDLIEGQRALFALGLFSIVQVDIPPQPQDQSVQVQVNLERSRPRHVSAETGYHQREGITAEGRWSHRNFLDGARTLILTTQIQTGLLATAGVGAVSSRSARAAVALTQPHVGTTKLRAIIEPFILYERDPLAQLSSRLLGFNRREYGASMTMIYGIQQDRFITLRYNLSRTTSFTQSISGDAYDRSVLLLSGTLGWIDNLLRPTQGFIVQPLIEQSGLIESWLGVRPLGLRYHKMQMKIGVYIPISQRFRFSGHLKAGRIWPRGSREITLYSEDGVQRIHSQFVQPTENRFDALRYYIGGADDVRGWSTGLAGPKAIRTGPMDSVDDGAERRGVYEPVGGLARISASAEVQFQLGGPWYGAAFMDAGVVSSQTSDGCSSEYFEDVNMTRPILVQCGFKDDGKLSLSQVKIGTGLGVRYDTPIGFIRFDVATKLNPDPLDLQSSGDALNSDEATRNVWYRYNVHFSIGQAF